MRVVGFGDCLIRGRMWPWCNSRIFWVGNSTWLRLFPRVFLGRCSLGGLDEEHEMSSSNNSEFRMFEKISSEDRAAQLSI